MENDVFVWTVYASLSAVPPIPLNRLFSALYGCQPHGFAPTAVPTLNVVCEFYFVLYWSVHSHLRGDRISDFLKDVSSHIAIVAYMQTVT
jgi:hypothetical protein